LYTMKMSRKCVAMQTKALRNSPPTIDKTREIAAKLVSS